MCLYTCISYFNIFSLRKEILLMKNYLLSNFGDEQEQEYINLSNMLANDYETVSPQHIAVCLSTTVLRISPVFPASLFSPFLSFSYSHFFPPLPFLYLAFCCRPDYHLDPTSARAEAMWPLMPKSDLWFRN